MVFGAWYTPDVETVPPIAPSWTDQMTPESDVPVTDAENETDPPVTVELPRGDRVMTMALPAGPVGPFMPAGEGEAVQAAMAQAHKTLEAKGARRLVVSMMVVP